MDTVDLEWRLIYSMIVTGKSAKFANSVVARMRGMLVSDMSPIGYARLETYISVEHGREVLKGFFRRARTGNYETLTRGVVAVILFGLDLRTCTPGQLEAVPGIGPKTARFFIAWTRPDARVAVLDRHVLRWMRENGHPDAPVGTPTGRRYAEIERAFLAEADRRGKTPRELDLEIWGAAATAPNVV